MASHEIVASILCIIFGVTSLIFLVVSVIDLIKTIRFVKVKQKILDYARSRNWNEVDILYLEHKILTYPLSPDVLECFSDVLKVGDE